MLTKEQLKRCVILRNAGWTLASIVQETNVSASSLQRHLKRLKVARGAITSEAIDMARLQLEADAGLTGDLKAAISQQVTSDIAASKLIQDYVVVLLDELQRDSSVGPNVKARSLTSLSTALKVLSDVSRRALQITDSSMTTQESLPQLIIRKMTDQECLEIQNIKNNTLDS
jgi:hypothetical protein